MIEFRPVGYILGWLILGLGGLMLVPFFVDLANRDPNARGFALAAVLSMLVGASVALACAESRQVDLTLRQGFLLTSGSWAIFPAFAGLPLMFGAPHLGFTDAYFEFTSALTTTGSTVIVGIDGLPRGALLWRLMVTWVGGIGVILLAMILLPVLNIGGMQMLKSADFNTLGKIMPEAKSIVLSIGFVYLVLTLACTLGYLWAGVPGFDAISHSFSTVATGGMTSYDSSFAIFPPAAQWVATVFMLLGAMSFIRFVQFARGEPQALLRDSQIRAFLAIYLCLAAALFAARLLAEAPLSTGTAREVLFSLASVITTTGFAVTDYSLWGPFAETIFFCAMMICGCSGSTSGGPKVFRYQLLLGAVHAEVRRLHSPSAVFTPRYQGVAVTTDVMDSVIAFFMLFFLTLGLGAVALVLLELDPVSAITGAAASLTNVGPGLGPVLGPVGTYAPLPDAAKWVCSFLMLVGRLEIMTAYVLFTAAFWRA
jgi:trk system potassium uptake protein TrkH